MTSPIANPMDAVTGLMQERQRFEGWLSTLESRRAVTPPHVYERVRVDYEGRLRAVLDQLAGRTSELQSMADTLTARLAHLQAEESTQRDIRGEAELRAAVGEYAPEQWEEIARATDEEISRLTADRTGVSAELGRLQQILSMAGARRRPDVPPASARPAEPEPAARVAAPADMAPEPPVRTEPPARPAAFDELAFLHSVVDERGESRGAQGRDARRGDAAAAESSASAPDVASAAPMRAAPAPAPDEAPRQSTPASAPQPVGASASSQPGTAAPTSEATRRASSIGEGVPSFLRDVPAEQAKTLKCQECGTMNYPTEWYCERCGGELAAM